MHWNCCILFMEFNSSSFKLISDNIFKELKQTTWHDQGQCPPGRRMVVIITVYAKYNLVQYWPPGGCLQQIPAHTVDPSDQRIIACKVQGTQDSLLVIPTSIRSDYKLQTSSPDNYSNFTTIDWWVTEHGVRSWRTWQKAYFHLKTEFTTMFVRALRYRRVSSNSPTNDELSLGAVYKRTTTNDTVPISIGWTKLS